MKLGRTEDARTKYTQFFDRCLEQANADPLGAQKQRDLMLANAKLGEVELMLDNFSSARSFFQSGIAILDAMIEKQMLVDSSKQEKAMLEERIHFCDLTSKAVGNWEDVQKSDSSSLPALLAVRIAWFSRRGNVTEVAQAGAKLRDFEPKTKDNLYNAACAYSLCAGFLLKDTKQLNEDEQAMFHNFTQLSLACLREAIGAGFNDYQHIRQDTDLAAIQKLPEFEKLLIEGKSR